MHKTRKRTPKGVYIAFKSLKQKLTRWRMKNDIEVDYGRNSVVPQPRFSLLSSSSLRFLSISLNARPWNPLLSLPHAYL